MDAPVRILSFNIGQRGLIRTLAAISGGSISRLLEALGCDILCIQETKCSRVELNEAAAIAPGVASYFSFNRLGVGYAGVATFASTARAPVVAADEGLTGVLRSGGAANTAPSAGSSASALARQTSSSSTGATTDASERSEKAAAESGPAISALELDGEGRALLTDHGAFVLINVYAPALSDELRLPFKRAWNAALERRAAALRSAGRRVVVAGDLNIAHTKLDHCDAEQWERRCGERFEDGEFRKWLDAMMRRTALIDPFRWCYPRAAGAYTCWNTATSARENNYGTRIDYVLCDADCVQPERVRAAQSMEITRWFGSAATAAASSARVAASSEGVAAASVAAGAGACATTSAPDGGMALAGAGIMQSFTGSDHCPVWADFYVQIDGARGSTGNISIDTAALQPLATVADALQPAHSWPEFTKRQQSIRSFVTASASTSVVAAVATQINTGAGAVPVTGTSASAPAAAVPSRSQDRATAPTSKPMNGKKAASAAQPVLHSFFKTANAESAVGRKRSRGASALGEECEQDVCVIDESSEEEAQAVAATGAVADELPQSNVRDTHVDGAEGYAGSNEQAQAAVPPLESQTTAVSTSAAAASWTRMLSGPPPLPNCSCGIPSVLRVVKKKDDLTRVGKVFYSCTKPAGKSGDPNARCNFFLWHDDYVRRLASRQSSRSSGAPAGHTVSISSTLPK